jgi:hypothetical protein
MVLCPSLEARGEHVPRSARRPRRLLPWHRRALRMSSGPGQGWTCPSERPRPGTQVPWRGRATDMCLELPQTRSACPAAWARNGHVRRGDHSPEHMSLGVPHGPPLQPAPPVLTSPPAHPHTAAPPALTSPPAHPHTAAPPALTSPPTHPHTPAPPRLRARPLAPTQPHRPAFRR